MVKEINKIVFSPVEYNTQLILDNVPPPQRTSSSIPQWFKDAPRFHNDDKEMKVAPGYHNLTVRHCMPFLDAMTSGYTMSTWTDIYVERVNGQPIFKYSDENIALFGNGIINYHEQFQSHVKQMKGYDPFLYAWSTYWRIKTPENVSCLFTHPLNQTDLPFFTLSGITDTDKWQGSDVLNFALVKDFEGLIPKGTPYVQIIPFYRNEWESEVSLQVDEEHVSERHILNNTRQEDVRSGYYRDRIWSKKVY